MKIDEDRFINSVIEGLSLSSEVVIPPGDDCAAVQGPEGTLWLYAIDQVVADVHYHGLGSATPTDPGLAGRKLLARNLSDIAAMGGTPLYALVCLAASAKCPEEWLLAFMQGVAGMARGCGVQIIGGDLGAAATEVGSLAIIGQVEGSQVLRRDSARPGDVVLVTGAFGGSLQNEHHLRFSPRLKEGQELARHARCGIDVSDGLLKDLSRLAGASKVTIELMTEAIPLSPGVSLQAALVDGEDYELIVTVPAADVKALLAAWPDELAPLTEIGRCRTASAGEAPVRDAMGRELLSEWAGGWSHFR